MPDADVLKTFGSYPGCISHKDNNGVVFLSGWLVAADPVDLALGPDFVGHKLGPSISWYKMIPRPHYVRFRELLARPIKIFGTI